MVYELNLRYTADPGTEVLLDSGDIISLEQYIQQEVASRHPAYIVGDSISGGVFSIRFPTPLVRQDAIDFVAVVKPYLTAGIVNVHDCYHDAGQPCSTKEKIDQWGVVDNGNN